MFHSEYADILEKTGKFLCYVLRHRPEVVPCLTVDTQGWAKLSNIISGNRTEQLLREAVKHDSKGRFEIREAVDGAYIRCLYGHSIPHVKITATRVPSNVPHYLYHGTTKDAFGKIKKEGLKPMSRNEVNLSSTMALAYSNGIRYAKSVENLVILAIESPSTILSLRCNGDIWCTDYVPPEYLFPITQNFIMELHEEHSRI